MLRNGYKDWVTHWGNHKESSMPVNTEVTSPKSTNRREHRRRRPRKYPDWCHDVISITVLGKFARAVIGKGRQVWRRSRLEILHCLHSSRAQLSTHDWGSSNSGQRADTAGAGTPAASTALASGLNPPPRQYYEARSESGPFSQMPSPPGAVRWTVLTTAFRHSSIFPLKRSRQCGPDNCGSF
jgi:hypothetical protein